MQTMTGHTASTPRPTSPRDMDIVQRYLADVRRYEVLSREEERTLALRFKETEDPNAERMLVNSNLRLVVKIAMEYRAGRGSMLDLIQEGNVGLMHAVRKYDPEKNVRLASYAQWWIRAYVLKYLMDNHKMIRIGTTQAQRKLFYNLKKDTSRLERQGLVPTVAMLARSLRVREREVIEMQARLSGAESSLDAPIRDEENGTLGDLLEDNAEAVDDLVERSETATHLRECLNTFAKTLEGRDVELWNRRMVADNPYTLQQMGDLFGVSRERARQLEKRIATRLEAYVLEQMGNSGPIEFPLFA